MTFTRTNAGISNMHIFHDADIVIYTEGGSKSFSCAEVEDGSNFNETSVDIKFWTGVLKANNFSKKVHFRALGSKESGKVITRKIMDGEIMNTAIAKDRDLDQFTQTIINSPFILYTKGYSWENDVFQKEFTLAQIECMILESKIPEEALLILDNAYNHFKIVGKNLIKLEILFRLKGIKFTGDLNGDRFFKKNNPKIDTKEVIRVINNKKINLERPLFLGLRLNNICPLMSNYGKLLEALSMSVINYICKTYSDHKSIPKLMIETAMIERFIQKLSRENDHYYSEIVNRLQGSMSIRVSN